MKVSRSLVAFAYVAESFQSSGDIGKGLLPLFAPIIAARAGTQFSPEEFAEDVKQNYDIEMHPYVAEEFAPRLAAAGYLTEVTRYDTNVVYQNNAIELAEPPISEDAVNDLLDQFAKYSAVHLEKADLAYSKEALEKAFLDRLVDTNFLGLMLKPDKVFPKSTTLTLKREAGEEHDEEHENELRLDFLVASFILHVEKNVPDVFQLLVSISSGALVSEVILNLQHPPQSGEKLDGLKIVLDGPLIMDVLGLGQPDSVGYAKLLIEQLRNINAELTVFEHTIEEIEGAIRSPLTNYERGHEVYGPLGRKLLKSRAFAAYLRSLLGKLREEINNIGVAILPYSNIERSKAKPIFSDRQEEELANSIGMYSNAESKLRDARSVADVLRLRGSDEVKSIGNAKYIFVTRNTRLANLSRKFLVRQNIASKDYFPPCITDRQMAGLLWIMCGGGGDQLSRSRLIANCTAATMPRKDVVSSDRTPVTEHGGMWEIDHIRQPPGRTPQVVSCPVNGVA